MEPGQVSEEINIQTAPVGASSLAISHVLGTFLRERPVEQPCLSLGQQQAF